MLKLIVNGDDFGLTEKINLGILKSFHDGILNSTSLIANGKAFEHAVEIIKENPGLDVGIHLTLIEEEPVLSADKIPTLIKEDKSFYNNINDFVKRYFLRKISLEEVKVELISQIEKVLSYGVEISHIDSHQHVHMLPKILDITLELAEKYKIPFIRLPKQKVSAYMLKDPKKIKRLAQLLLLNYFCLYNQNKIPTRTDHFTGFFSGGRLDKNSLLTVIKNLPQDDICELMCHPGIDGKENLYSHWEYHSEEEMDALIDPEVKDLIYNKGISLVSFNSIIKNNKQKERLIIQKQPYLRESLN